MESRAVVRLRSLSAYNVVLVAYDVVLVLVVVAAYEALPHM
jgi:hypothetical protein